MTLKNEKCKTSLHATAFMVAGVMFSLLGGGIFSSFDMTIA